MRRTLELLVARAAGVDLDGTRNIGPALVFEERRNGVKNRRKPILPCLDSRVVFYTACDFLALNV